MKNREESLLGHCLAGRRVPFGKWRKKENKNAMKKREFNEIGIQRSHRSRKRNDRSREDGGTTVSGFTLIELMIVVAIVGIMTVVTMVSLSGGREAKEVEGEARKFAATVRELQNYSLTGRKINASDPPTCMFGIDPITQNDSIYLPFYQHRHINSSSCSDISATRPTQQAMNIVNLQNGVTFASDRDLFGFSVPRGELVNLSGTNNTIAPLNSIVQVQLSKGSSIWSVCVYPGGRVEEHPGASCP